MKLVIFKAFLDYKKESMFNLLRHFVNIILKEDIDNIQHWMDGSFVSYKVGYYGP